MAVFGRTLAGFLPGLLPLPVFISFLPVSIGFSPSAIGSTPFVQ